MIYISVSVCTCEFLKFESPFERFLNKVRILDYKRKTRRYFEIDR